MPRPLRLGVIRFHIAMLNQNRFTSVSFKIQGLTPLTLESAYLNCRLSCIAEITETISLSISSRVKTRIKLKTLKDTPYFS